MTAYEDPFGPDFGEDLNSEHLPQWLDRAFEWTWSRATGTKTGFVVFVIVIYVIPYGLGLVAVGGQVKSGGDFAVLGLAALIASTFASAQPSPTPAMGTLAMVLAGFMGAYFDPVVVGFVAGAAGTTGLVVSYGIGAAGIGRLLIARMEGRPAVISVIEGAFDVTRRHGPWAILVLAFVPNPFYAWSSVAAGASKTPFGGYFLAAATGSVARFILIAFLGTGIERLLS